MSKATTKFKTGTVFVSVHYNEVGKRLGLWVDRADEFVSADQNRGPTFIIEALNGTFIYERVDETSCAPVVTYELMDILK